MPYLIQKKADGSLVNQWDLHHKPLGVGRGDQVEVQVDDTEMSRSHFLITPVGSQYVIQDLDSRNGTWVNGVRIEKTTLKANDRIRAGQTSFLFVDGLGTVIGQLEKDPKGYGTFLREIS